MIRPANPESLRGRLHHAIRREFSADIARRFKADPDRYMPGNEDGRRELSRRMDVMHRVLLEVDEHIAELDEEAR